MSDIRLAVAVSILSRAILELAAGKGMKLRENDNLLHLASITNRVEPHELVMVLQDANWRNQVRSALFDGVEDI